MSLIMSHMHGPLAILCYSAHYLLFAYNKAKIGVIKPLHK